MLVSCQLLVSVCWICRWTKLTQCWLKPECQGLCQQGPAMQVMPGDKEQVSKMLMSATHQETDR
jgi:hypothetical protein